MKNRFISQLVSIFLFFLSLQQLTNAQSWHQDKFSMFIHYGLYSHFGGVWMNEPVTRGYSEQILSFGIHFSDWYEDAARSFDLKNWDANKIATLAKEAGMRSIVFTSKHHDGFCMFKTATTPYNAVEATPSRRDPMKELSEACREKGLNFGVYFSLIDWHFPPAMPISSHNADSITPEHHRYNMQQVRELMSNYGPISEIWFDMGSLTPAQSQELYSLVHGIQPDCKISGRLGNGYHDFSVMADNQLPEEPLVMPWQTAASIYPETWGYRSWQKQKTVQEKIDEKITDLVRVVARGGNYLLNIGPKGDGSVVKHEEDILKGIGQWLKTYGKAIYGSGHTPYNHIMPWGECTRQGKSLYLFVLPEHRNSIIRLLPLNCKPQRILAIGAGKEQPVQWHSNGERGIDIEIPDIAEKPWIVLRADFAEESIRATSHDFVRKHTTLSPSNAEIRFAHTCGDYYTGRNIAVSQTWHTENLPQEIRYTEGEKGKIIDIQINGSTNKTITLNGAHEETVRIKKNACVLAPAHIRATGGVLGSIPKTLNTKTEFEKEWLATMENNGKLPYGALSAIYYVRDIVCSSSLDLPVEVVYNNGIHVLLNGKQIHSQFIRGTADQKQMLLLPLNKGKNRIVIKYYNRFAPVLEWGFKPLDTYKRYNQPLNLPKGKKEKRNSITISGNKAIFPIEDIQATNIRIR